MFFIFARFSSSAYSSVATIRAAMPVVRPWCSILQRADHISVSVAGLMTWAWKVRIFSTPPQEEHPVVKLSWEPSLGSFGRPHLHKGE